MSDDTRKVERRHNHKLRSIFDEAYERVVPFLDPRQTWGGVPLERLAFRALRDAYPKLSPEEVRILVTTSVRVYRANNPGRADYLPRPGEIDLSGQ